jgi:FKBP-type peptidyl-prolyl cis-trans isomerase FkpA
MLSTIISAAQSNKKQGLKSSETNKNDAGNGFTKLNNVIDYKIIVKPNAKKVLIKNEDVIFMHMKQVCGDSILNSTYRDLGNATYSKVIQDGRMDDYSSVLCKLGAGDSAIVRFNADSVLQKGRPPFYKEGDELKVHIKIVRIVGKKELDSLEADAEKQQEEARQKEAEEKAKYDAYLQSLIPVEDSIILDYANKNKLKLTKTQSGLYYTILEKGTGILPIENDKVDVIYRGTYLNDTTFDVNQNKEKPFTFTLGTGMVIRAWDEGVALLPVGSKAVFLIPSRLGYGDRGYNEVIPGNTILRYDLEILNAKK